MISKQRIKDGLTAMPPALLLHLDNCGRENKNHTVLAVLGALVEMGLFREIYLTFLPVGHTHAKVDQRFSRISVKLRPLDLPTLPDMQAKVSGKCNIHVVIVPMGH